jgi:hypothetical protein
MAPWLINNSQVTSATAIAGYVVHLLFDPRTREPPFAVVKFGLLIGAPALIIGFLCTSTNTSTSLSFKMTKTIVD